MNRLIRFSLILTMFLAFIPLSGLKAGASSSQMASEQLQAKVESPLAVCTPDTSDMITYWPLDAGSELVPFEDTADDPGGFDNPGACTGTGCPTSSGGLIGTAFDFDGGNDGITVTDHASLNFLGTDSLTFEAWVRIEPAQTCMGNKVFIGKNNDTGSSWWLGCGLIDNDPDPDVTVAIFHLEDESHNDSELWGTTAINDNIWHHVVGIRDDASGNNYLYVDGAQENSETIAYTGAFSDPTFLSPVSIGYFIGGYRHDGLLDEVAIYKKALTETEIQAHYNGGIGQSYCNMAPVADDDDLATDEDTPLDFTGVELLANDSDPDGAPPAVDSVDVNSSQGGTITDLGSDNYQYVPPVDFTGVDTFAYTIIDGALATDVGTVSVTVGDVNDPPEVTDPGNQMDDEGDSPTLQIVATDMDGDTLTYSAAGLPPELSTDPDTGLISGTITQTANDGSPYAVTVTITDGTTPVVVNFDWTVNRVNVAPDLTQPADRSDLEGDSVTLPILATDVDGDVLEYSALGLPPGLSIDPDTGVITGDIADGASADSPFTVTITVTEVGTPEVLSDEVTFSWTVTQFISIYLPLVMNAP